MKKEKFLGNIIGAIILIFYGSFLLLTPSLEIENLHLFLSIFFGLYGIVHCVIYGINRNNEYSDILLGLTGIICCLITIIWKLETNPKNFALFLLGWILLISLIKLKKADYFHDRKSKFWFIEIASLLLFLLCGVLVSINLFYEQNILILIFGFYAFLLGVLEFYESLLLNLTKGKIK